MEVLKTFSHSTNKGINFDSYKYYENKTNLSRLRHFKEGNDIINFIERRGAEPQRVKESRQ